MLIQTLADLKSALRQGPYAWPGGYSLRFYTNDSDALCYQCVKVTRVREEMRAIKDHDRGRIVAVDVLWEGSADYCAHCNEEMPSEYGDPDADPDTDPDDD